VWVDDGVEKDQDILIVGPCIVGKNNKIKKGASIDSYSVIGT